MMPLTVKELEIIMDALQAKYGFGYSKDKEVGVLQAKLSIIAEIVQKKETGSNQEKQKCW